MKTKEQSYQSDKKVIMHLSSNNKTTPQFFSWPPEAGSKGESVAIDCTKVHKTFLSVYIIVYRYADVLRSTYQILGPHITGVIIQLISVPRFSLSATTGFSVLAFFEVNSSVGAESAKENADVSRSDDCCLHAKGHNVLEDAEQQREKKRESRKLAWLRIAHCLCLSKLKKGSFSTQPVLMNLI